MRQTPHRMKGRRVVMHEYERPRRRYSGPSTAARDAVTRTLTALTPEQIDQAIPALFEMIAARSRDVAERTASARIDPGLDGRRRARRRS